MGHIYFANGHMQGCDSWEPEDTQIIYTLYKHSDCGKVENIVYIIDGNIATTDVDTSFCQNCMNISNFINQRKGK